MGQTGRPVTSPHLEYPTREDIVDLNRTHIARFGGEFIPPDNLLNPGSLEWVLEAIQYPLFGVDRYPSLEEKAATLAWIIISRHVFYDGNKRTGMSAMIIFLEANGYLFQAPDDEIIEAALQIAQVETGDAGGEYSFQAFVEWVRKNVNQSPDLTNLEDAHQRL